MFIASRGKKNRTTKFQFADDEPFSYERDAAALFIQRLWRGLQARLELSIRRDNYNWKKLGAAATVPRSAFPPEINRVRVQIYSLLEDPTSGSGAKITAVCILCVIILSVICLVLETVPELKDEHSWLYVSMDTWRGIEVLCTAVFTVEFVLRLFVCNVYHPISRFVNNVENIFDFLAIAPFYVELMGIKNGAGFLRVLRAVRLTRVFRVFNLGRYSHGLRLMGSALMVSSNALYVLVFFLSIGVVLFSSIVYYAEKLLCPDIGPDEWENYEKECNDLASLNVFSSPDYGICCNVSGETNMLATYMFPNIVETFWWAIVTMTTVGYGDKTPQTAAGKLVGSVSMLCGILLIALPVAIVGRNFQEAYEQIEGETALDHSKTAITRAFKAKMDTFPKPQRPPLSNLKRQFQELDASLMMSFLPRDMEMEKTVVEIGSLLGQTEAMSEALYKLQSAELVRQDEIFNQIEQLVGYVQRRNRK
eukprot:GEMP01024416.1.p1 GENE.GEMP01024416.1~~GEMP01024416.1.p1  ORF type:complete len:478 (+),score=90.39 GEMP01024416.1:176-1609(+)